MSQIRDYISNDIVKPTMDQSVSSSTGVIMSYNALNNTATVNVYEQKVGKFIQYENVPFYGGVGGITGIVEKLLSIGDRVHIIYIGGDKTTPVILCKTQDQSRSDTTSEAGSGAMDGGFFGKLADMINKLKLW